MCGLHRTLGHRVWHEEEIELAFDDFGLLNETSVHIGALWRVVDEVSAIVALRLLEESLTYALVNDDQSDLWWLLGRVIFISTILDADDAVKLSKLLVNDLLAHGVTDTVTVDKDMPGHGAVVELTIGGERSGEVVRQDR